MEKLAKVYFWRSGQSPGFRHDKFEPLLRDLDTTRTADFYRMFGYQDQTLFNQQKHTIFDLGTRIQNLVPAGGNKGPNPEYPWPPTWPTISPLDYTYIEWKDWNHSEAGRRLRYFVKNLLDNYLTYFP